jgi:hypothetical protein
VRDIVAGFQHKEAADAFLADVSTRAPIHGSRPAINYRTGPPSTRRSSARASPNSCCGRNTPSSTRTAATAIPSSASATRSGRACRNAPCARLTRPVRSASSTMPDRRSPSSLPRPARSGRPRSSSPCWAPPATPTPRRAQVSHCRTGSPAMSGPSNTLAAPPLSSCRIMFPGT